MKVEKNKENLDLLSPNQICLWNILTNPTNLSINLAGVLYFGIFFKKIIPPIYRNGGSIWTHVRQKIHH
jgi:hypothetical protein